MSARGPPADYKSQWLSPGNSGIMLSNSRNVIAFGNRTAGARLFTVSNQ